MSLKSVEPSEFVVLYGVPWEAYEGLLDALPDHNLRHAYDRGTFELRSLLWDVSWDAYERILEAFGDHPLAHTYDRGSLEILMSPRVDHDWIKSILGRVVEMIAFVLDIPIKSVGSTTLWRRDVRQGLQPDEGYYVHNEPRVRGKLTFDPDIDPPPDLAIEVDVTSKSIKRLPVYAALGVPEVWRHDGHAIVFFELQNGNYEPIPQSRAFPFLKPDDLNRLLEQIETVDETSLLKSFANWVRVQATSP